jgi:hypothetical protein
MYTVKLPPADLPKIVMTGWWYYWLVIYAHVGGAAATSLLHNTLGIDLMLL